MRLKIASSSNGRTADSDSVNLGSSPGEAAILNRVLTTRREPFVFNASTRFPNIFIKITRNCRRFAETANRPPQAFPAPSTRKRILSGRLSATATRPKKIKPNSRRTGRLNLPRHELPMNLQLFTFAAPTQNRLRAMQIVIPVIIHVVEFVIVRVPFHADDDAIFRRNCVADTRLKFFGVVVVVEVEQRIRGIIFVVGEARVSRKPVVEFASDQKVVVHAADGRVAVGNVFRAVFSDFVARAQKQQIFAHENRVVRQIDLVLLMRAGD